MQIPLHGFGVSLSGSSTLVRESLRCWPSNGAVVAKETSMVSGDFWRNLHGLFNPITQARRSWVLEVNYDELLKSQPGAESR